MNPKGMIVLGLAAVQLAIAGYLSAYPDSSAGVLLVLFVVSLVSGIAALFRARAIEDDAPELMVKLLLGVSLALAAISLFTHAPLRVPFARTLTSPYVGATLPKTFTYSFGWFNRVVDASAFVVTTWAVLGILRAIERRPSYATLFTFSATLIFSLVSGSPVFITIALLTASLLMLVQRKWPAAYVLLGFALGPSFLSAGLVALFLKHQSNFVKKEVRTKTLALMAVTWLASALVAAWPNKIMERLIAGRDLSGDFVVLGLLIAAIAISGLFIWRAEVSGKDSVLYAVMLVLTTFVVATLDLSAGSVLILLPLAAIFRSAPQLWLVIVAGLLPFAIEAEIPWWGNVLLLAVFAVLFVMQLRHAYRETGLFRQIEVRSTTV